MKKTSLIAFAMFFAVCLFAQNSRNNDSAISDADLNRLVTEYLENTFNRYLKRNDLRVSEVTCAADWNASKANENLNYYTVRAKFRNFPLNKTILSGRLETVLAVRKNSGAVLGIGGKAGIRDDDQKQLGITLFVNDELSDEARESLITGYIRKNRENPLDIHIYKERTEIYADGVYSYVSAVVNNDRIVYVKAIFEKQPAKTDKVDIFTIQETSWQVNRSEEIFSCPFPDSGAFKKDIQKDMFEQMRGFYSNAAGDGDTSKGGSKIESVTKTELKEANDGLIKLELDVLYMLDLHGFIGSYKRYAVLLDAFYAFNINEQKWEYKGIEKIQTDNIRLVK
jgi:hypothetical protein